MMKSARMMRYGWKTGIVLLVLCGCVAPYRMQTMVSPSMDACRYKTYAFLDPDDQTLTHWLSDPHHRKSLEDLLRASLDAQGLKELPAGGGQADILVRQRLETRYNNATQTTEGVIMAADYKYAKWTVELAEAKSSPAVWSTQMEAVIGDLEGQNLSRARAGLRNAFAGFPSCRK